MKATELRANLGTMLFVIFSIITVFTLLDPVISEAIETLSINNHKFYINLGWIKVYLATLLTTFVLILLFMDKRQVWLLSLGIILGSILLVKDYRIPGVVQVLNLFEQNSAANFQTYIPYLAIALGTLLLFGLLKVINKIFK